jgi:hypothetical protein
VAVVQVTETIEAPAETRLAMTWGFVPSGWAVRYASTRCASTGSVTPGISAASVAATAQRVFQERLAYSPKRDEARRLLEEIARAEREGRADDAAALAAQLDVM